jgi:RimJ/RimL family protein N-acetyltransferase
MIRLRKFELEDAIPLQEALYPNMPVSKVREIIAQWNEGAFDGKRFEMMAVMLDESVAGYVSLYQQEADSVSFGVEIAPCYRCRGIATVAGGLAISIAAEEGYRKVVSQVRQDNAASVALHKKLGFVQTEATVNRKGNPVFHYEIEI